MWILDLPDLVLSGIDAATGRGKARAVIGEWARANDYRLVRHQRCRRVREEVREAYGRAATLSSDLFYEVTVVDSRSVERIALVRVHHALGLSGRWSNHDRGDPLDVRWLREHQLTWREHGDVRPPSPAVGQRQGWCADPTRQHEQRWFSAGMPTDLVRDGAVEGRNSPEPTG